ncbi:MAG TPA: glycosyltransferase family A protein [Candidatus Dormibacteraeota bacterium]|nr:glycosyltransferase family A protein [Candidatus Dormibacteraeota bacterium]
MAAPLNYVLITPARNEANFIERTLKSVVAQTLRPVKWVIVSDGSTDGTDDIVKKYVAENLWIELVRMPERRERHFAGKVMAFNAGWDCVKHLPYSIIGSLDADISFESDYFEFLLAKFAETQRLGVAGTPFTEGRGTYDFRFSSLDHVSGGCQLFRRECFDAIGGYIPIKGGGIDLVAVVTARMRGWQTRSFPEKVFFHHRKMGTGTNKGLKLPFKWGQSDHRLGSHPVWQTFRCVYQMSNRPYLIGGLACLMGYCVALISRRPRAVSKEFAAFRGKEQMQRLKKFFSDKLPFGEGQQPAANRLTSNSSAVTGRK